jgi:hypothetical protein
VCTDLEAGQRECGWKPGGSFDGTGTQNKRSPRRPEEVEHRDLTRLAFSWKALQLSWCQYDGAAGAVTAHHVLLQERGPTASPLPGLEVL